MGQTIAVVSAPEWEALGNQAAYVSFENNIKELNKGQQTKKKQNEQKKQTLPLFSHFF